MRHWVGPGPSTTKHQHLQLYNASPSLVPGLKIKIAEPQRRVESGPKKWISPEEREASMVRRGRTCGTSHSRTDPANVMLWESGLQITAETRWKASGGLQNRPSERSKPAELLCASKTITHIDFGPNCCGGVVKVQPGFQTVSFGDSRWGRKLLLQVITH